MFELYTSDEANIPPQAVMELTLKL